MSRRRNCYDDAFRRASSRRSRASRASTSTATARRDLRAAWDEQLIGRPDVHVLEGATNQGRVVAHDVAFSRSAIRTGTSFVGIIYLRPGHISASFVLAVVDALRESTVETQPPLIVVAERQQSAVRVRARTAPP
jgi:hypothetical protein